MFTTVMFFLFFYKQNPIQIAFIFILFIYSVDNYKIYIQIYFIEILLKFDKLLERWLNLCVLLSVYFWIFYKGLVQKAFNLNNVKHKANKPYRVTHFGLIVPNIINQYSGLQFLLQKMPVKLESLWWLESIIAKS